MAEGIDFGGGATLTDIAEKAEKAEQSEATPETTPEGPFIRAPYSRKPEPSADAPKGWTWDKSRNGWKPRRTGETLWHGSGTSAAPEGAQERPQRDPEPSWSGGGKKTRPVVTPKVRDDMAGFAGLIGTPLLAMLQAMDPYCGTVLADNYTPIIDAVLPLVCRSERVVKYFQDDSNDWLLWAKLAAALKPVGVAIAEHHILRTVQVVRSDDGGVVAVRRGAQDWSQYPAEPAAAAA